jgi:hypothetical protein
MSDTKLVKCGGCKHFVKNGNCSYLRTPEGRTPRASSNTRHSGSGPIATATESRYAPMLKAHVLLSHSVDPSC